MAAFEYNALDVNGARKRGLVDADSERHARRLLREQELTPLEVRLTASKRNRADGSGGVRNRVNAEELALFTRLLGTLLHAGLPLDEALAMIAQQSDSKWLERIVLALRASIQEGHGLEQAMDNHPQTFPDVYRATIGAGERTRHLPLVLEQLAGYVESRERVRQQIRVAMLYPAILTTTAVLVVSGLLIYVVPQVIGVFEDVGQKLPLATRMLIAISDFSQTWGLVVLLVMAALIQLAVVLTKRPAVRFALHQQLIRTPLIGKFLIQSDSARFARTLSILLSSGVDMLDALAIAAQAVSLLPLRKRLNEVVVSVREGESLSVALQRSNMLPGLLVQLTASGENSGELPRMLDTAAMAFEQKTTNAITLILGIIEPALIFLMGALVLFIVIAILLPIFEMNQLI